jgi:hypothetical protein
MSLMMLWRWYYIAYMHNLAGETDGAQADSRLISKAAIRRKLRN